jgi:hypothetical protein
MVKVGVLVRFACLYVDDQVGSGSENALTRTHLVAITTDDRDRELGVGGVRSPLSHAGSC